MKKAIKNLASQTSITLEEAAKDIIEGGTKKTVDLSEEQLNLLKRPWWKFW